MAGVISYSQDDVLYHQYDLADPNLELDLTSDPWNLLVGQASIIRGLDVIHRGRLAPNGGRKPLAPNVYDSGTGTASAAGFTLTDATKTWPVDGLIGMYLEIEGTWYEIWDNNATILNLTSAPPDGTYSYTVRRYQLGTLTAAETADMAGTASRRWKAVEHEDISDYTINAGSIVKLTSPYAWPAEMVGGYIYLQNGINYYHQNHVAKITSISTTTQTDDTLNFTPDHALTGPQPGVKIEVVYPTSGDKRGIWVTNGRKFWLLHDGVWVLYLDLHRDSLLGETWHVCRIANHLVMFVNPKYAARIVRLDADVATAETDNSSVVTDNSSLAGLIKPKKPDNLETEGDDDSNTNKSWFADSGGSGSLTGGSYKIKVRAVNLDDGAESEFVNVYDEDDRDDLDILLTASETGLIGHIINQSSYQPPPYHERWTHIEVWRTTASGAIYYLEARIPICELANEGFDSANLGLVPFASGYRRVTLSDSALAGQPAMLTNDLLAGKPPPICQRAVNVLGVTICAGKASDDRVNPRAYSANFFTDTDAAVGAEWTAASFRVTQTGLFTYYVRGGNDVFRIFAPAAYAGDYGVNTKIDANTISLLDGPPVNITEGLLGCILTPYEIEWPYIESDEDVWYSRTDKYAPESFQIVTSAGASRILRVSSVGDVFRNLVVVGNYACMVMSSGVHLLYFDSGLLAKDTVITYGGGTPWANSVVVYDNVVVWARPEGPRILVTSNEPDSDGHRGRLGWLDAKGAMRQWFEDAWNNGYEVDAGIDAHSGTIRFRRKVDANTYETLEYSYLNKRWTQMDDDSGDFYAASTVADTTEQSDQLLYSLDEDGAIFQENHFGLTHPYDDCTVQDVVETIDSGTGTVADHVLTDSSKSWTPDAMIGDMVSILGLLYEITDNDATSITIPSYSGTGTKAYTIKSAYINKGWPDTDYTSIIRINGFHHLMEGDVIRITLPGVTESVSRVIRSASSSYVAFDSITGLDDNDEGVTFRIAPMRFCLRWAPLMGKILDKIKTLRELVVRAFTGPRNHAGGSWPDPPTGKLTLSSYREYHTTAADANIDEIGVFDEGDTGNLSEDRVSALEGQGSAITLELSTEDTRTDFRLELVKAVIEEESDVRADQSTAA